MSRARPKAIQAHQLRVQRLVDRYLVWVKPAELRRDQKRVAESHTLERLPNLVLQAG
jgi:hypothetical protein